MSKSTCTKKWLFFSIFSYQLLVQKHTKRLSIKNNNLNINTLQNHQKFFLFVSVF